MPLSDTAIKKSLPADKPYTLTDSGGLYLLVMPTGGKLWRWSYRFEKKEGAVLDNYFIICLVH
jgi:hypothetical protein